MEQPSSSGAALLVVSLITGLLAFGVLSILGAATSPEPEWWTVGIRLGIMVVLAVLAWRHSNGARILLGLCLGVIGLLSVPRFVSDGPNVVGALFLVALLGSAAMLLFAPPIIAHVKGPELAQRSLIPREHRKVSS